MCRMAGRLAAGVWCRHASRAGWSCCCRSSLLLSVGARDEDKTGDPPLVDRVMRPRSDIKKKARRGEVTGPSVVRSTVSAVLVCSPYVPLLCCFLASFSPSFPQPIPLASSILTNHLEGYGTREGATRHLFYPATHTTSIPASRRRRRATCHPPRGWSTLWSLVR